MMRWTSDSMKPVKVVSMKGSMRRTDTSTTNILGTKVRVISWICVSACKNEITRPTARAMSMIGAPSLSATTIVSCAMSMASVAFTRASDRQLGDVLVGLDDFVANGDHRLERNLRVVHGGRDRGEIGLPRDGLKTRRLPVLEGVDSCTRRLLEQ